MRAAKLEIRGKAGRRLDTSVVMLHKTIQELSRYRVNAPKRSWLGLHIQDAEARLVWWTQRAVRAARVLGLSTGRERGALRRRRVLCVGFEPACHGYARTAIDTTDGLLPLQPLCDVCKAAKLHRGI